MRSVRDDRLDVALIEGPERTFGEARETVAHRSSWRSSVPSPATWQRVDRREDVGDVLENTPAMGTAESHPVGAVVAAAS